MSRTQQVCLAILGVMAAIVLVVALVAVTYDKTPEAICLRSHIEVTPESWGVGPRVGANGGLSFGLDGGIGIGYGVPLDKTMSVGPTYKPEKKVKVCDEWATPTPEVAP